MLEVLEGILTVEGILYLPAQTTLVSLSIPCSLLQVSDLPLLLGDLSHVPNNPIPSFAGFKHQIRP